MIAHRYRFIWFFFLFLLGAGMAWISYAGMAEHLRTEIAIPLALILPSMLAIAFFFAKENKGVWRLFALAMVILVAIGHGVAANTHLNHEDSDLTKTTIAASDQSAKVEQLDRARRDYALLLTEIDTLSEEVASLEASLPDITALEAEIAALEAQIYQMDNDGQKWNDAQIPALQAKLATLVGNANRARPVLSEQRADIAGKKAIIAAKTARAADRAADVAALDTGVTAAAATATAAAGRQKFLFQLASHLAGGDSLKTQALLALGGLAGGVLIELIYGFCWMVPVAPRGQRAESEDGDQKSEAGSQKSEVEAEEPAEDKIVAFHNKAVKIERPARYVHDKTRLSDTNPIAANISPVELRVRSLTVAEIRDRQISRADADKALRRLVRKLNIPIPSRRLDGLGIKKAQDYLVDLVAAYPRKTTLGDILAEPEPRIPVETIEAIESLELAA